jgi:hypothetical protein
MKKAILSIILAAATTFTATAQEKIIEPKSITLMPKVTKAEFNYKGENAHDFDHESVWATDGKGIGESGARGTSLKEFFVTKRKDVRKIGF